MHVRWWLFAATTVVLYAACGSDDGRRKAMSAEAGAAGTPGDARAGAGGATDTTGATGGAAGDESGAPVSGAAGATGGDGAGGAGAQAVLLGNVQGLPFAVESGISLFNPAGSMPYIESSLQAWDTGCDRTAVCDRAQLNFTLYAQGGTLADIVPGTYPVGDDVRGAITFNVVGAAGRYDVDCGGVSGTFSGLVSGTLTIESLTGGHLVGSVDFTTEGGDTLTGPFDSTECPL